MKAVSAAFAAALLFATFPAAAADTGEGGVQRGNIEEITVFGKYLSSTAAHIDVISEPVLDVAESLARLPGADTNANGRLSGIAQYRGLYGDRVVVTVDGIGMISGGPNAMDAPLSYLSPMITEELILERGIPGVASAPESVGGHVDARLARGAFGSGDEASLSGMLGLRYSANGDTQSSAGRLTYANRMHRLSLLAEADRSDGIDTPVGRISPSQVSRDRFDVSYAYSGELTDALFFVGALETVDTGTPALAMDIRDISTVIYGAQFSRQLTPAWELYGKVGYNDVDHIMDNFGLRSAPPPMRVRQNDTEGKGGTFELASTVELSAATLTFGIDGRRAEHASRITNPNNPAFFVNNFNNIERDVTGAFGVVALETADSNWELGLRYNEVSMDADVVGTGGMMGMMAMNAQALADAFNASDRSKTFGSVDAVLKYRRSLSDELALIVDVGSKARAPSYQEMYLWLPLQATGGLADGRSYIGNLDLAPERNNEVVLGLHWETGRFELSPRVYYRDVDDYIQGVPTSNMTANMVANMMGGANALQFANVDAEISGADIGWRYSVSDRIVVDGNASVSNGRRTDVKDKLYRLSPANATVAINLIDEENSVRLEWIGFTEQDDVSAYNDESPSAGYGIVNALWAWEPTSLVRLELQAINLLDKGYQPHTAGINRVRDVDIPVGERLYGAQRSVMIGAMLQFN